MSIENNPSKFGESSIISVSLPDDATGIVGVEINGKLYAAKIKDACAIIAVDGLDLGNYTARVTYYGDDKYEPVDSLISVQVIDNFVVTAPDVVKYYSGSERLNVDVYLNGNPLVNEKVIITINGVTYTRFTDKNGHTSLALNLNSKHYTARVEVRGLVENVSVLVKPTIIASDLVKVYRNNSQFYATILDGQGNTLANTNVLFNIHGVFYNRTTNANGVVKLNINLEAGEYILTAYNQVTSEKQSFKVTVLSLICENRDLVKYYKNDSQYVVKIIDEVGNPASGVHVTFNVNGVFYTATTNASGHAKLNINLNPGMYIITAEYAGCKVSNNITVLPVLFATDLVKVYGSDDQFVARLLDGKGNPYPNQNVSFQINNMFYTKTTDSSGHAKLDIRLMRGNYIITSGYNGAKISNKITIT